MAGGTLRRDSQQLEVAARLDALLIQLHGYRAQVELYRAGVQQYKARSSHLFAAPLHASSGVPILLPIEPLVDTVCHTRDTLTLLVANQGVVAGLHL